MKTNVKVLALAGVAVLCPVDVTAQVPAPRRGTIIPSAPVAHKVWVPGHHVRRGRDYIWVDGYYQTVHCQYFTSSKPARYKTWNPGYWREIPQERTWVKGYWSY